MQAFQALQLRDFSTQNLLLEQTRCLERKYTDIDSHYGWVLAADRAHVARMFQTAEMAGGEGVGTWMKRVSERHAETRDALREWVSALEKMVEESG